MYYFLRKKQFQVYFIATSDAKAIETFLNGKKFLMGDQICNEDASMFALLATAIYHDRTSLNKYIMGEYI